MSDDETQISAVVSTDTKVRLDRYVRTTGVTRGHVIEQALLHHLQAVEELPAEYIIQPRIVVGRKTGEDLLRRSASAEPTEALHQLMRDGD